MKELQQHIKEEVPTEQMEQKKTVKFYGSLTPHPGQQLYQLDIAKAKITLAEFESTSTDLKGKIKKRLLMKDGCMYVCAINQNVADNKFRKMINKSLNRK